MGQVGVGGWGRVGWLNAIEHAGGQTLELAAADRRRAGRPGGGRDCPDNSMSAARAGRSALDARGRARQVGIMSTTGGCADGGPIRMGGGPLAGRPSLGAGRAAPRRRTPPGRSPLPTLAGRRYRGRRPCRSRGRGAARRSRLGLQRGHDHGLDRLQRLVRRQADRQHRAAGLAGARRLAGNHLGLAQAIGGGDPDLALLDGDLGRKMVDWTSTTPEDSCSSSDRV